MRLVNEDENGVSKSLTEERNWEMEKELEPIYVSKGSTKKVKNSVSSDVTDKILTICRIMVYLAGVGIIACFAYACMGNKIDIYAKVIDMKNYFKICIGCFILDAILVNILDGRKISLFIFSILLGIFYPSVRDKKVDGGGFGTFITIGICLAIVGCTATSVAAGTEYGDYVVMHGTAEEREAVLTVMEQLDENGKTIGSQLKAYFDIEDVKLENKGSDQYIVLSGKGSIIFDSGNTAASGKKGNTVLVFKNTNGTCKLVQININNKDLSKSQMKMYNDMVFTK